MSRLGAILLCVFFVMPVHAIDSELAFEDPEKQARYKALTKELRCLQCMNETIADSNAFLAADLRRQVKDMMANGDSDREIKDYMVARYGDFVLYKPPLNKRTIALWGAPFVLMFFGLVIIVVLVRKKAQMYDDDDSSDQTGESV